MLGGGSNSVLAVGPLRVVDMLQGLLYLTKKGVVALEKNADATRLYMLTFDVAVSYVVCIRTRTFIVSCSILSRSSLLARLFCKKKKKE